MTTLDQPSTRLSTRSTQLKPTLSGLAWLGGYAIGGGLDAVTGEFTAASALVPFEVQKATGSRRTSTEYRLISNESEFQREIDTSVSGSYNFDGVNVGASASYIDKISFSELSLTVLLHYESSYETYDRAPSYALSKQARELYAQDPERFRSTYGDYFVAGKRRGASFVGVYVCTASTVKSAQEFSATLKADMPEMFSAEGAVKFEQAAAEHDVEIDVRWTMHGQGDAKPPHVDDLTPKTLLELYNWFVDHEEGAPVDALAYHYSTLDPDVSRSIPVAPSVFVELRELYDQRWRAQALFNAIPEHYQEQLQKDYDAFVLGLEAASGELATDASLRDRFRQLGASVVGDLVDVGQRQAFFAGLAGADEPAKGKKIYEAAAGPHVWAYGFSSWSDPAVVIHHTYQAVSARGKAFERQKKTLEVGPDSAKLLVGWTVQAYWTDGTDGYFSKELDRIIGTDHAAVFFASLGFRGYHWGLTVYWVDAADYQF